MGRMREAPTEEMLEDYKRRLFVDENGTVRWRTGRRQGEIAGYVKRRRNAVVYRSVGVDHTTTILAHHLAWFLQTGRWPTQQLDHVDGNGLNNKLENLRESSQLQNTWNSTLRKSKHGYRGVERKCGKWYAHFYFGYKKKHLGTFSNILDAARAAEKLRQEQQGHFYRCLLYTSPSPRD